MTGAGNKIATPAYFVAHSTPHPSFSRGLYRRAGGMKFIREYCCFSI